VTRDNVLCCFWFSPQEVTLRAASFNLSNARMLLRIHVSESEGLIHPLQHGPGSDLPTEQYSSKTSANILFLKHIIETASSSKSDINCYLIVRKLLDSIFSVWQEPVISLHTWEIIFRKVAYSMHGACSEMFQTDNRKGQHYWGFGLRPSSGILKTRKHNVSETASVSILRWGKRHLLCWVS
jgi:hypothetical protein